MNKKVFKSRQEQEKFEKAKAHIKSKIYKIAMEMKTNG
jgi:hypothetical protein